MEEKVKITQESKLQKRADKNFENVSKYQTNPINAKFISFKKTKKEIKNEDLI